MQASLNEVIRQHSLAEGVGEDGHHYTVKPFIWTIEAAELYWPRFDRYHTLPDDIPQNIEGFLRFILGSMSVWFEVIDTESEENVGFIYFTDFNQSWIEKRFLSCSFHGIAWDANVAERRPIVKAAIREMFHIFGFHRMGCTIPAKFGGAIRTMKKLGFTDEGRLRSARRYNGTWFDVIVLSILESELG